MVELGTISIINHIKLLLWDRDIRSYSYYIETSVNQTTWDRVIDHTKYNCRSWQFLYFGSRAARYIKLVGTHNTCNRVFHVVALEAYYTAKVPTLVNGLILPTYNVATVDMSALVIEGVSRTRNALLNGDVKNYDWDSGYTCHQLGKSLRTKIVRMDLEKVFLMVHPFLNQQHRKWRDCRTAGPTVLHWFPAFAIVGL